MSAGYHGYPRHFAHTSCNGANASESDVAFDDDDDEAVTEVDASDSCAFDVDAFGVTLSSYFRCDLVGDGLELDRKLAVARLNGVS